MDGSASRCLTAEGANRRRAKQEGPRFSPWLAGYFSETGVLVIEFFYSVGCLVGWVQKLGWTWTNSDAGLGEWRSMEMIDGFP